MPSSAHRRSGEIANPLQAAALSDALEDRRALEDRMKSVDRQPCMDALMWCISGGAVKDGAGAGAPDKVDSTTINGVFGM